MTMNAALSTSRPTSRRGFTRGLAAVAAILLLAVAGPRPAAAAEPGDPAAFVRHFTERAMAVLADESLAGAQRERAFRRLLTAGFDIKTVGRFVLGRYWRKATEAERAEYGRLFEDLIVATYARQLLSYAGETLKVEGVRQQDGKSALVASRLLRAEGEPIRLDWRLLRRGDTWRIVDVVVEGMSMALSQRSEFKAVIRGNGGHVEALLEKLREKTRRVESGGVQKADNSE
ncbi:MAG: ABC transporter substrate-binding protein [Proteobacteria bacterium]|nr:ABC transporter substrate-binding protein [Pseudomonadota bacterium]